MNVNGYCEDYKEEYDRKRCDCDKKAEQFVDIALPIEICPDADLGKIETECCGEPCIECEQEPCGSSMSIIITQSVKIKIPVRFGVKTIEGNGYSPYERS
ncbi:MAG: hypothetical protein IIX89_04565, partial [Oscillospiraceae bacterium]|nr:hypothetical protein [Oscillospiraceae bacterium]